MTEQMIPVIESLLLPIIVFTTAIVIILHLNTVSDKERRKETSTE